MATFSLDQVEIFGTGVLQAEGVVIDTDGLPMARVATALCIV